MGRPKKTRPAMPADGQQAIEPSNEGAISKADAVREALSAGKESPDEGVEFIKDRFGIEISKTHFSSSKSKFKRKEQGKPSLVKKKAPTARASSSARPTAARDGGPDVLEAMDAI